MSLHADWRVDLGLLGTVHKWLWVPLLVSLAVAVSGGGSSRFSSPRSEPASSGAGSNG